MDPRGHAGGSFVTVALDDAGNRAPGELASLDTHRPTFHRHGNRWFRSQLALDAMASTDSLAFTSESPTLNRSFSTSALASSADDTAAATATGQRHASVEPRQTAAVRAGSMDFAPVTPRHGARGGETSTRRVAEGRYRSRIGVQSRKSAPVLRLMAYEGVNPPQGVRFDATMSPGVSMTVADDNGELYIVRSPNPMQSPTFEKMLPVDEVVGYTTSGKTTPIQEVDEEPRSPRGACGADLDADASSGSPQLPASPTAAPSRTDAVLPETLMGLGVTLPRVGSSARAAGSERPPSQARPQTEAAQPSALQPHNPARTSMAGAPPKDDAPQSPRASSNLTRMAHLPPKPRKEEAQHLTAFLTMMRSSKATERQRAEARAQDRRRRMSEDAQKGRVWKEEILPCWTRAREQPRYRELWWGGIPAQLRTRLWARACGNALMLPQTLYARALDIARDAQRRGKFPAALLAQVERDVAGTLPTLRLFDHKTGPLWADLTNILHALIAIRADEAAQREKEALDDFAPLMRKYALHVRGSASLAAVLVMNMPPAQALIALLNLVAGRSWLKAIYQLDRDNHDNAAQPGAAAAAGSDRREDGDGTRGDKSARDDGSHMRSSARGGAPTAEEARERTRAEQVTDELLGFERIYSTLLSERMPSVYANLHKCEIRPQMYVREWIRTLFVPWLEIDAVMHLWDIILLDDTDATLYRIALALVELLEPRLYVHDPAELRPILRGTHPGVLRVWRRETDAHDTRAPRDRIYAQYCIDEAAVFGALKAQESWWKDLTFRRLMTRELRL
ncbi:hypothetical protein MSPP1_002632 [Malassezia sp. CBS 17886]|nr:hypothetical protein MSPP1_002632 [Malassezia sp. CBS 17886]